ncbi:MAG: hypothetical protein K2N88_06090 [Muribaculaceae bacterium]|nr:hypothetical protein [Muribaculaceae bacterium]
MKKTVVISFGDSAKYRVPSIESSEKDLKAVEENVKTYLKVKFPEIEALPFYSSMKVEEVDPAEAANYDEFNADALKSIRSVLVTEVKDARSLDVLNSDAPYSDINPDAL